MLNSTRRQLATQFVFSSTAVMQGILGGGGGGGGEVSVWQCTI